MTAQVTERLWVLGSIALVALLISLGLMVLLRPWLARYAMVQPNARSSHLRPTPQGGGIAVVIATLLVASGAILVSPALLENQGGQFLALLPEEVRVAHAKAAIRQEASDDVCGIKTD